ncbi:HepT-like ribonuclease domain-containing protein [Kyrpidia tusciae]|uniref:HepT-like ribonuclease domain-containing protein n=1 Tax=Kyrpidia tusciae TaxID=33943 RepID=UPI002ADD34F4|nr:HepT-like ribonuclease domain-containing protein [Kyrpidia tusciae]
MRNLEVIGEASKNVSDEIRGKYPEIPWKKMIGLKNILIHEYFGIDESIVWEKAIQEIGDIT